MMNGPELDKSVTTSRGFFPVIKSIYLGIVLAVILLGTEVQIGKLFHITPESDNSWLTLVAMVHIPLSIAPFLAAITSSCALSRYPVNPLSGKTYANLGFYVAAIWLAMVLMVGAYSPYSSAFAVFLRYSWPYCVFDVALVIGAGLLGRRILSAPKAGETEPGG